MTETDPAVSPPPPQSCGRTARRWLWGFLGVVALAGAVSVTAAQCPWLRSLTPGEQTAPSAAAFAALQRRVEVLEARAPAPSDASAPPPALADTAAVAETVKTLEARIAQLEHQDGRDQQTARKLVAAAFAFLDVREAAAAGRAFAPQLAALRAASGDDEAVVQQTARLDLYASAPPPTMARLRASLAEAETPPPAAPEDNPSFTSRVKTLLRPLVSVHPLRDPVFAPLEQALDSGDAAAAAEAAKALPAATQKTLAAWQTELDARAALDDALRVLTSRFTALPAQGGAP